MDELEKTFIEEYEGAVDQFNKERFKNATILSSKALFALCDFLIYSKLKKLPKTIVKDLGFLKNTSQKYILS